VADIRKKGIHIEAICKRYGKGDTAVDALKGVEMQVFPGEVVGLIAVLTHQIRLSISSRSIVKILEIS